MTIRESSGSAKILLADNARVVLERRYLAKDSEGRPVETPEEMFRRVARNIAQAELLYKPLEDPSTGPPSGPSEASDSAKGTGPALDDAAHWEERFYELMARLEFLPNSPTLMNAGRDLQQLSACFVLPVPDSIEGIFQAIKDTARIHQSGGGTGFSFSKLRPEGDRVQSTMGVASGPVSFLKVFDAATEAIKQGGTRRGANMGILAVTHPDIEKFITLKSDMRTLTNFNVSVAVTEGFMRAVEKDEEYELINPRSGEVVGRRRARHIFDLLVANAWRNGDPGIVFIDRINRDSPTPNLGEIEATNPCGEQPLLPYESCNLGSLNLAKFVKGNGRQGSKRRLDWQRLAQVIPQCVRFLDNVIDMSRYPIQEIDHATKLTRKIGLGIMGWHDALLQLRIPYDSEEALSLGEEIMRFIQEKANEASLVLSEARGHFPAFEGSRYDPDLPYRNSTRTTVAPTGTLSIVADCSSGIEPVFSLAFTRQHYLDAKNPAKLTRLLEANSHFVRVAKAERFHSDELMDYLASGRDGCSSPPRRSPRNGTFVCRPHSSATPITPSPRRSTSPSPPARPTSPTPTGSPTARAARGSPPTARAPATTPSSPTPPSTSRGRSRRRRRRCRRSKASWRRWPRRAPAAASAPGPTASVSPTSAAPSPTSSG